MALLLYHPLEQTEYLQTNRLGKLAFCFCASCDRSCRIDSYSVQGMLKKAHRGISDITREEFIQWTNGLWTFPGETSKQVKHPTPFSRELPRRCLKLFSYIDDTVLDPFSGSGTTILEALCHNRSMVWRLTRYTLSLLLKGYVT